jgi:hypothetical protein
MDANKAATEELRRRVLELAEEIATALLGDPTLRRGSEWRWERKGSFALSLRGEKRGLWRDHESQAGGDLFALIMREKKTDFPGALQWARDFLRMPATERPKPEAKPGKAPSGAARRAFACRMWAEGVPLTGTVAERYLLETRKIPLPSRGRWPWPL